MNQAVLYSKYNGLQKTDAIFVLDNYFNLIKWDDVDGDDVLDIGSGAGDVTEGLLLSYLPKNFNKLIGVDLSEEMVEFAKTKSQNSKVFYQQLNISDEDVPVDFEENFNHIFSFYCLHWIQNQRKGFENIFKMMKPGGDMLITFLASNPIFDIYESLSKKGRWESYMDNIKKYISPYQHSKNPDQELQEHLDQVGFETHLCKVVERLYVYPNVAVLKKSVTAVTPFFHKIQESQKAQYLDDYLHEVKRLNLIESGNNNNEERIKVPYKLFVVHASKPKIEKK